MNQEKLLIDKILKGETSSFGYFVDTYQDMALTIAIRICGNRQDAEDVVQNAFVKSFHNLHTFRATSKFSTWLYQIVYNTAINEIRGKVADGMRFTDYSSLQHSDYFVDLNTKDLSEEEERRFIINEAISKLPKIEALILTLYYTDDKSIKEIAFITQLSEPNIKIRLHRARQKLKELLKHRIGNDILY